MSAPLSKSSQHPPRGKRSVSFSCPTPLRTPTTPITPLSRSATSSSISHSPIYSRSLSWNTSSTSTTDRSQGKFVAWEDQEDVRPIRWNAELEQRLVLVERELKHHQKKWSAGQEDFHHELEHLHELKRAFKRFVRRRRKDEKVEGRRFLERSSLVTSDAEIEDSELDNPQRGIGATLKRRMSAPSTALTSDDDEVDQLSTAARCKPPNRRRFSLIHRVISPKDASSDNDSNASSIPVTATTLVTSRIGVESSGETESDCPSSQEPTAKNKASKKKKKRFGGLLRRVTFPGPRKDA